MNIEELELSLRSEFEGQVRNVLAGIKQDVADFQKNFEAEFEKHRSELDRTINELSARLPDSTDFDPAFTETVTEHLRLARDDGAQVAAIAFGEAEKLKEETPLPVGYDLIRDAINDISSKNSQASILKSLVDHAEKFTPRGAFFIVKNDHFVGWRAFGDGVTMEESAVRDIHLSVAADTILSASVISMSPSEAVVGVHADDSAFLDALEFGRPDRMYAIPLTARGRGVAVLYADFGNGGKNLNVEALETLVRVAGLTVELLAASQMPRVQQENAQPPAVETEAESEAPVEEVSPAFEQPVEETYDEVKSFEIEAEKTFHEQVEMPGDEERPVTESFASETVESYDRTVQETLAAEEQPAEREFETIEEYTGVVSFEEEPSISAAAEPETSEVSEVIEEKPETYLAPTYSFETNDQSAADATAVYEQAEEPATGFAFGTGESYDSSESVAQEPVEEFVPAPQEEIVVATNGHALGHSAEPVVEVVTADAGRTRLSDRNVDLPIEVADEERRLHNDARRFARLLVSEIKLYNEQKVVEGRESGDLYDRLREAIDRSREMYNKRVQPAVASKFDYFHYEIVNSLAEGEDVKLGSTYPGAII